MNLIPIKKLLDLRGPLEKTLLLNKKMSDWNYLVTTFAYPFFNAFSVFLRRTQGGVALVKLFEQCSEISTEFIFRYAFNGEKLLQLFGLINLSNELSRKTLVGGMNRKNLVKLYLWLRLVRLVVRFGF